MIERARTLLAVLALLALACGRGDDAGRRAASGAPAPPPAATPEASPPPPSGPAPVTIEAEAGAPFDLRFGLALAPDGRVVTPVLSYAAGDAVCLSLALPPGSSATRLSLRWLDVEDRPAGATSAAVAGDPPRAALCLPGAEKLARGTYTLEVAADGRALGSGTFAITDLRQTERAGGA